jgi:hypothetical protein
MLLGKENRGEVVVVSDCVVVKEEQMKIRI